MKIKKVIIAVLVVLITFLHYGTEMSRIYYHIFYRELYFLPLILAGFWFGLRGGVVTSFSVTAFYLPFVLLHWQGSPDDFDKILQILLFNIVAVGLGYVSDREKAEEKAKIDAERQAREQAESADRLKSDFLSVISHELRTPLVSIIGYNELLIDGIAGKLTEEQIDALKKIDTNSKKLLDLINSIIELSRLEAKSVEIKEVSIPDVIKEVEAETKSLQEQSSLNFVLRIETDLPTLLTDPGKLKVVLKNLVSNALKFTKKGNVIVGAHRQNRGIEISVTDTGIGIAPEALQLVFEPFRQVESPLIRQHGGVGLGLYIVKRLLEILHGTIKVESEVGRGSTFRIWIPSGENIGKVRR